MNLNFLTCRCGRYIIYQKWVVFITIVVTIMILFSSRTLLGKVVPYLLPQRSAENRTTEDICSRSQSRKTSRSQKEVLNWDSDEEYYISSAFYIGYVVGHVPGGIISDLYGTKLVLLFGLAGCAVVLFITPFILTNTPWYCTAILNTCLGFFQGQCMPASFATMAKYIPIRQISFLGGSIHSFPDIGGTISVLFLEYYINTLQMWRPVFYIIGCVIIIWICVFAMVFFPRPSINPFICEEEKQELEKEIGSAMPEVIPWMRILGDASVLVLMTTEAGQCLYAYTIDDELARYFANVQNVDISNNSYVLVIPVLCQTLSALGGGYLADYIIQSKYAPVDYIRVMFTFIGTVVPMVFVVLSAYAKCNKLIILTCFILSTALKGFICAGYRANMYDLSRNFIGTVMIIQNGIAVTVGPLAHFLLKYMCKNDTAAEWRNMFWLGLTVNVFCITLYFVWAKGTKAKWDDIKSLKEH